MSSQFGMVDNSLWRHKKFKAMSDDAKHIFLYLKTCSHQNMIGCFYMPLMYACSDLNWTNSKGFERVSKGFTELHQNRFIRHCEDTETVFLVKHMTLHPIQNANQMKGASKLYREINNNFKYINDLAKQLLQSKHLNHKDLEGFRKGLERVSKQVDINIDVDKEEDIEEKEEPSGSDGSGDPPAPKRFKPPSVDEVREYCDKRGNQIDPEYFVNYYTANGWVQGKGKKVKCWKSCVLTWESRDKQNGNGYEKRNRSNPRQPSFSEIDYSAGVNPDGTIQ